MFINKLAREVGRGNDEGGGPAAGGSSQEGSHRSQPHSGEPLLSSQPLVSLQLGSALPHPNGGSARQPVEPVTPSPDLCRGLQAPLLLIKISKDFEKETIRLKGLRRPQMLAFILFGCRVQGQVTSAWEILGPPEPNRGFPTRDQQGF